MKVFYERISREAEELLPRLQSDRRALHRYPEVGWTEFYTTAYVVTRLRALGYEVQYGRSLYGDVRRMGVPEEAVLQQACDRALERGADPELLAPMAGGYTGCVAVLPCGEGPTVALRFDIDALPVFESVDAGHRPAAEGFCSETPGQMHACGHDGHTAIGLAVAELLMGHRAELRGTVKLIFQPAEEGLRGAQALAAAGHVDDVDYIIGNHLGTSPLAGFEILLPVTSTLASSKLDIAFRGKAAHAGASPEQGCNALLAAATAALNIHAIPRYSSGITRVNVGTMTAGTGRNVVPDRALLQAEVRGETTEVCDALEAYCRSIAEGAARMHGCTAEVTVAGAAGAMESDKQLLVCCKELFAEELGLQVLNVHSSTASEDCAVLMDRVRARGGRGVYIKTAAGIAAPLHSSEMDFDEEALPNAVKALCAFAYDRLTGPGL